MHLKIVDSLQGPIFRKLYAMKIIGLFGLLLCVFGCQNSNSTITKLNYPVCLHVCLDSIDVIPEILMYEGSEELLKYNLLYIGGEKDTIFIDYKLGLSLIMSPPPPPPLPPPPPPLNYSETEVTEDTMTEEEEDWSAVPNVKGEFDAYWCSIYEQMAHYKGVIWDSATVDIIVDTSRYVLSYNGLSIAGESFKAYPVVIKNIEHDTVVLAIYDYIELILEGQTDDGWKTLKEPFRHIGCDNGVNYLLLPPNEILVTSIPVYKWKKSTQLRLKLGNNYSATFRGNTSVQ